MKYSLFIGRWQPFHKGHKTLIEKVLKEGKNVCIAIRDTRKSKNNPYDAYDRRRQIYRALNKWGPVKVKTIIIPDIEEVCYGRKVGWGIREIRLDKKTENISATKIRGNLDNRTIKIGKIHIGKKAKKK